MRIAILVWSRIWGGLESHVMDLATTAAGDGHEVVLVCVGQQAAALFKPRGIPATIRVIDASTGPGAVLRWYRQFRALNVTACLFEKGTLHTGSLAMDLAARAACRVYVAIQQLEPPRLGPRRSTRHFGGLVPGVGFWWYRQRFLGWLRSLAPMRTVCITEAVRSALEADYGFSSGRLDVIHNGVDVDRFTRVSDAAGLSSPGLAQRPLTLGTAARLVHEKGIDVAIRAFARVVQHSPDVPMRLLIANDGPERESLEALARDLGLTDRVQFSGFQRDLPAFYRSLDIFLVPSRIEAQGLIVLEAMACECLVIASAAGGIPEMITGPELGTLVPPDDAPALATAIEDARRLSPDKRAAQAAAARAHVCAEFVAQTQCRKILSLTAQLAAEA
jgi:glycosyltransferase involved in cell wall biosynthesis